MNRNCLIIENNEVCARVLEQELRAAGLTFCSVSSLWRGIEIIYRDPPDLIFLDLSLHTKNAGLEFLEFRKDRPMMMEIPVIVVSGSADLDTITKAMQNGADGYLIKPIQTKLLKRALEEVDLEPV